MRLRRLLPGLPIWLWVALALVSSSAIATTIYSPVTLRATVVEPISISPSSFSVSLYPNEEKIMNVTVTNIGPKPVTLEMDYEVVNVPSNGDPGDITVTTRTPFTAVPGTSILTIVVKANNGAVPGSYTISLIFSRPSIIE